MTAAAPLRRSRCGGAAFAVAALLSLVSRVWGVFLAAFVAVCSFSASANVICIWINDHYECSGEGNHIDVYAGGEGEQPYVITNIVGTCTNCVAMSPEYVRSWKGEVHSYIADTLPFVDAISRDAQEGITLLGRYTNTCEVSPWVGMESGLDRISVTNFLHSVGVFSYDSPKNFAAELTRDTLSPHDSSSAVYIYRILYFYDGAALAYNQFQGDALNSISILENIVQNTDEVAGRLDVLDRKVEELSDEQCTAQWGGGSGGLTNQVNGNWCTYDQGEAIKDLLDQIKEWNDKQVRYLTFISNRVSSIDFTIKSALFTTYDHIPTEEELETTWQDLYLSGYNSNFPEYASTNIVARIELLLAGISGVLTNVNDYASQDDFADESLDSTNLVENAIGDFTNEFVNVMQGRSSSVRSIGDALVGLYQKFRTWSGTPFSTENLINSYSVEFESGKSLDVPGFAAPSTALPWANTIRVICRSAMSVIWITMSVAVFIRFQIAFFQWCLKYVKWAVEILQGLFL